MRSYLPTGTFKKKRKEKQKSTPKNNTNTDIKTPGRPTNKLDEKPRKQRVDTPRSNPGVAELLFWSEKAWSIVSDITTNAYIKSNQKKNLRQLTKKQVQELEELKLDIFTNLEAFQEVGESDVLYHLKNNSKANIDIISKMKTNNVNTENMSIEDYRTYIVGIFVEHKLRQ